MTNRELLRRFPGMSKSVLELNAEPVTGIADTGRPLEGILSEPPPTPPNIISLTIHGQIRGGKNNMIVTNKGKHIPKPEWAKWRDEAVADVVSQLPKGWEPISVPIKIQIDYVAGDHKRRDFPAICDSIFHVLERARFVEDDTLLWPAKSSRSYDKQNPRAVVTVLP